ncbi:MAG: hypothetical protein AAGF12_19805 [Myxococcota bacterium]
MRHPVPVLAATLLMVVPFLGTLSHLCRATGTECCCLHFAAEEAPEGRRAERPECCEVERTTTTLPPGGETAGPLFAAAMSSPSECGFHPDALQRRVRSSAPSIRGPPPRPLFLQHQAFLL